MENKKVLLGMSGGVDSSVAALLLKEQGYEVIGVTLELVAGNSNTDTDAKNVCNQLEIPHFTYDCKQIFKTKIIDDFISLYSDCKTPNPCIECNRYLKFGFMWEKAKELGCEFIATGHYAKVEYDEKYKKWVLKKSNAGKKDQSYVLWNMPKDGNYKKFLEVNSNIKPKKGNIVNTKGDILGIHTGLYNYTIGQRKGLGISNPVPLFVLGFDKKKNEVIVGEESELYKKEIIVKDINLLLEDTVLDEIEVKTRYSSKLAKARIIKEQGSSTIKIIFEEPQRAVTPGQSAVFYKGDIVLRRRKNCIGGKQYLSM